MEYPHFIGIGAARTGSTWLYHLLWPHPELWLPPIKELHYFDAIDKTIERQSLRYGRHLRRRLIHYFGTPLRPFFRKPTNGHTRNLHPSWDLKYFSGRYDISWYRSLFAKAARKGLITGEITPGYGILSPETIRMVRDMNPKLKIIFFARDPIARSWSAATKLLPQRLKCSISQISDEQFETFFETDSHLRQSDYLSTINNWRSHFPQEQFFVGFLEDIRENPEPLAKNVLSFLNVGTDLSYFRGNLRKKVLSSSPHGGVPKKFEYALAKIHEPRLRAMKEVLGGRAIDWHERAINVLNTSN